MYHSSFSFLLCLLSLFFNSNNVALYSNPFFRLNYHETFRHNVIRCHRTERRYYNSNYEFTMSEIISSCRRTKLWRQERARLKTEKEGGEGIKCRLAWNFVGAWFLLALLEYEWLNTAKENSGWRLSFKFCRSFVEERERGRGQRGKKKNYKMEKQWTV